ncbi:hypothetical protein [Planktomarina sp.]|jgi:hypothetical protein|uniref:hypothetical protein n=1 Tax=Planktomarina sp. TaxID=2024851 RepID=UPI0023135A42|nr:hypothetical protein [Gammaproteobacteria bacterium]|tara:strand:- start:307 stop:669 length:363 start_codon:yes stop_codon:yes gene_type:complete
MSEGKYLIYEGVIVKNLEQIWSNLWNQYVDIDENDDYEERYKLQPLGDLMDKINDWLFEHRYNYVQTSHQFFERNNLSLKEYWKDQYPDIPLPKDEFFRRKQEERTEFYKHHNMLNLIDD